MPRRDVLSSSERARLSELPSTRRDLVHHYTLGTEDLELVRRRRRDANRLGFAVQLAFLRFPGRALDPSERVPQAIVSFLAEQLDLAADSWQDYATRTATRREHLAQLRKRFGFRSFSAAEERRLAAWVRPLAIATNRGFVLVAALMERLRQERVLLPRLSVLERLAAKVRYEGKQEVYRRTLQDLSTQQLARLDALLTPPEGERTSPLTWLRQPPGKTSPLSFARVLSRLQAIRGLALGGPPENVPPQRMLKLARIGARMTPYHLEDSGALRRRALLAAHLRERRSELIDQALLLQDRLFGRIYALAKDRQTSFLHDRRKGYRSAVRLLVQVGTALLAARRADEDLHGALAQVVDWEAFETAIEEAQTLVDLRGFETLANLGAYYSYVRRYAPSLLSDLDYQAMPARSDLLAAIRILRELNASGRRKVPEGAPQAFIPEKWKPYVIRDGLISRRYYELCVLAQLRGALRSGDLFMHGSRHYRHFEDYLLPEERSSQAVATLAVEPAVDQYLEQRSEALVQGLERVAQRLEAGDLASLHREPSGKIRLRRSPAQPALNSDPIVRKAYALVPRIKITDLLLEVDDWTSFSRCFTHLRTGEPAQDRRVLLTAVLADGTNLGLTKMARACSQVSFRTLAWTADWFLSDEAYSRGLAEIVNHHHRHPFARYWGEGTTSSSDGQRFRAGSHGAASAQRNARYGRDPSIMLYTHISDQYSPFHTAVIDASARDATYVLDGLLDHPTELAIEEHYTDTSGFTDHVFALCHLLGFRFAPRIRALTDYRLYFPRTPPSTHLDPLVAGCVSQERIRRNWTSILRLAASIQQGTVSASLILRKLAAYPRQNELAWGLREVGRLERSLFTLRWFEDEKLQGRVLRGLNKGEAKNKLARAVFLNRLGEFRDRSYEDQLHRASALNLIVAAITLWNTVYLAEAVKELQRRDLPVSEDQIRQLSPLGWDHIGLTGDYSWGSHSTARRGPLRPLRIDVLDRA